MIGTTGGAVLFVVNIILAGVLGIGAGGLTCFVLHRSWTLRAAAVDVLLAMVVAVIATYVLAAIGTARGVWASVVGPVLAIAAASVVLRHVVRLLLRSPSH